MENSESLSPSVPLPQYFGDDVWRRVGLSRSSWAWTSGSNSRRLNDASQSRAKQDFKRVEWKNPHTAWFIKKEKAWQVSETFIMSKFHIGCVFDWIHFWCCYEILIFWLFLFEHPPPLPPCDLKTIRVIPSVSGWILISFQCWRITRKTRNDLTKSLLIINIDLRPKMTLILK